jgi:hypothetical protein
MDYEKLQVQPSDDSLMVFDGSLLASGSAADRPPVCQLWSSR